MSKDYDFGYNTADSVKFKDFGLLLSYEAKYYASENSNLSFIPAAIASDECYSAGYKGSEEKLAEINIITLANFNQNFRAGDTVNSIIEIEPFTGSEFAPIPLLAYINRSRDFGITEQYGSITFTQKPDPKIKQSFKVFLKLQNGETYEAETNPVKIF